MQLKYLIKLKNALANKNIKQAGAEKCVRGKINSKGLQNNAYSKKLERI